MRRRDFLAASAAAAALPPVPTPAQQRGPPVIGYLSIGTPKSRRSLVDGLRRGLSENGYIEGRNITIEYRWAEDKLDRFPALAISEFREFAEAGGLMSYGEHSRFEPTHRRVRRQNTQWRQTRRPADRKADQIRSRRKSKDRKVARPRRAPTAPRTRSRGD